MMQNAAVIDLTTLAQNMNNAAKNMPAHMERIRYEAGVAIFQEMLRRVPRRSNKLANSIRIVHSNGRTTIGPHNVAYAVFVEYGTGQFNEFGGAPYEIRPKTKKALAFNVGSQKVVVAKVTHPGIKPQRFIRDSVEPALVGIGANIEQVHIKMLRGQV